MRSLCFLTAMTLLIGCNGDSEPLDLEVELIRPASDVSTGAVITLQVAVKGGSADRVELLKDGESLTTLNTVYQVDWDTRSVPEATYTIGARAWVGDNFVDSNTIQITVDRTAPEVIAVSPEPGTDIGASDPIELTLSEKIDPASLTGGAFALLSESLGEINLSVSLSEDCTQITLTPTDTLPVPDGLSLSTADAVSDLAGNTIAENSWDWNIPTWRRVGSNITFSANTTLSFASLSRLLDGTLIAAFASSTGGSTRRFHVQSLEDGVWTDLTESIEITSIESDRVTFFGRSTTDMVVTWRSNQGVEVRRWNGAQWLVLNPTGVFEGGQAAPAATITPDGLLWVVGDGGSDCTAIGVASHNGSAWSILPDGPHPSIYCANGAPAVAVVDEKLTILGHSGTDVWISQWDGLAFTNPTEAVVASNVERLDHAALVTNASGAGAVFVQDGKLTTRLYGENGWFKPGTGQLNMRLDQNHAQLIDAAMHADGTLSVLFQDYTTRAHGPAEEKNYLTHWQGSDWEHTSLEELSDTPVALEHADNGNPLVIAHTSTTMGIREEQATLFPEAITHPNSENPCGPFAGDIANPESGFPQTLTETGCYVDVPGRVVVPHAVHYDINATLFSDGSLKSRYVVLPDNESTITYTDVDGWNFPVGTIIIKEFTIHSVVGDVTSDIIPMETRFMIRTESAGWTVASYRWASDGSEGFLREDISETDLWPITNTDNPTQTTHEHILPSRGQCYQCHGMNADDSSLGLETAQMNRFFNYNGIIKNQLEAWMEAGMLSDAPAQDANELPWHPSAADTTESLDNRFRAYLHSNCAHCHFMHPSTCGDMRFSTPIEDSGICDQINHADLTASMLYTRVVNRSPLPMPQLGTSYADPLAIELVTQWLESQSDCVAPENTQ